jgi:DNA-binding beta-propeller fold protein YncE
VRRLFAILPLALAVGCTDEDIVPTAVDCPHTSGTICTVAGNGVAGDGADRKLPTETMLYDPSDIAFAPDGALVIVDWNNHRIRTVQADGTLKIVAGVGELTPALGTDEVTDRLNHPTDVTFDPQGRMVIAAWHNSRIKRLDPATGTLEDIAGTGGRSYGGDNGPALMAILNLPASVLYDPAGNLLVSDQANQRIRKIDPTTNIITTVAGTGEKGFAGDGGPAAQAKFSLPVGQRGHPAAHITRSAAGDLYLADTDNNRIRRIDPAGMVSTVAGTGVAGAENPEGPALQAQLEHPVDVAVGPDAALYIADTENNCVRVIREGMISTIAGTCTRECPADLNHPCRCPSVDAACIGDGGSARAAHLKRPTGIALDKDGNVYIADTLNHRVRVVYH